jgi:hypothetical protein
LSGFGITKVEKRNTASLKSMNGAIPLSSFIVMFLNNYLTSVAWVRTRKPSRLWCKSARLHRVCANEETLEAGFLDAAFRLAALPSAMSGMRHVATGDWYMPCLTNRTGTTRVASDECAAIITGRPGKLHRNCLP